MWRLNPSASRWWMVSRGLSMGNTPSDEGISDVFTGGWRVGPSDLMVRILWFFKCVCVCASNWWIMDVASNLSESCWLADESFASLPPRRQHDSTIYTYKYVVLNEIRVHQTHLNGMAEMVEFVCVCGQIADGPRSGRSSSHFFVVCPEFVATRDHQTNLLSSPREHKYGARKPPQTNAHTIEYVHAYPFFYIRNDDRLTNEANVL